MANAPVHIFVGDTAIVGVLNTQGTRVLDFLNKEDSDFFCIDEPTIHQCGDAVSSTTPILIRKSAVSSVVPGDCYRDASPDKRYFAYKSKSEHTARIILDSLVIDGVIHAKGHISDLRLFLTQECRRFFPVTNARIIPSRQGRDSCIYNASTVLVNTAFVGAVQASQDMFVTRSTVSDMRKVDLDLGQQIAQVLSELRGA
jgi:hypothetical protein